ncbi:MAG TPA: amidohydrolase family protein [Allosphingosinicella sp.]
MLNQRAVRLSRREFIRTAAILAAASAAPRAFAANGLRLGDAHAHLFNLTDLPVRGYFEHVVLWNTALSAWPVRPLWPALLDLVEFLKGESITAEQELETMLRAPAEIPVIDEAEFGRLAFGRIARMRRRGRRPGGGPPVEPLTAPQRRLRSSYALLARVIDLVGDSVGRGPEDIDDAPRLTDEDIRRIRGGGNNLFRRDCPEAPHAPGAGGGTRRLINATLVWAREMMQSRRYHLGEYRSRIQVGGVAPTTVVNLLVDYDGWLGDGPAPGSSHEAQVRLWARMREDNAGTIDIRTFAGFDPLRDAEEHFGLGSRYDAESRFARNRAHIAAGRLHGLKLYPPMGFRPLGNQAAMFAGRARALGVIRRRWHDLGLDPGELPERLDQALTRLYRYCSERDVPILTHAYHGNEASQCAGAYAAPAGWLSVLERFPDLRLCIGHFSEAGDFVDGMERRDAGRRIPARVWPLHGTERLLALNGNGRSRVYVDIADMIELLHERRGLRRATAFFAQLRRYCDDYDRGCEHVMFGSDWIMLGRIRAHRSYVETIRSAMAAASWPEQWQRNLLHDNLQSFLAPRRR